jgi:hypothetical protein
MASLVPRLVMSGEPVLNEGLLNELVERCKYAYTIVVTDRMMILLGIYNELLLLMKFKSVRYLILVS